MLHFLAASTDSDLYIIWDWMQAVVGLLCGTWPAVF